MKFVIATGGSGGHFFPALRLARCLKSRSHHIKFMGALGNGAPVLERENIDYVPLEAKGFISRGLGGKIKAIWLLIRAYFFCVTKLRESRPDAVIGFGSYASLPVVLAAVRLRIPSMIHEQNVIPGKANELLSRFVKKIAVSFAEGRKYFPAEKTVLTGCPSQQPEKLSRGELAAYFRLKEGKKTVLVVGGSQGSRRINEVFFEAVKVLCKTQDVQVIHITGKSDYLEFQKKYEQSEIGVALFEFLDKMGYAYAFSDVAVTRAGAVTVTELAAFQLPAVMIPYPHALGHQRENAKVLERIGLGEILEENVLTVEKLVESILRRLQFDKSSDLENKIANEFFINGSDEKIAEELTALTL